MQAIQNKPVSNSSQSFQAAYGATVQDFRGQTAGRTGLNKEGGAKSNLKKKTLHPHPTE